MKRTVKPSYGNIIRTILLSINLNFLLVMSALAQETYTVTTFNGNIQAKDDSIAIIAHGESVTLKPTIPYDTFDGTVLDIKKWEKTIWNGATIAQNDRLIISTSGDIETSIAEVRTKYEFFGDFNVQVDFEIGQGWANPSTSHLDGAVMGISVGGSQYHLTNIRQSNGDQQIMLFSFREGEGVVATANTTANAGRYKISRSGDRFRFWYDIGWGWNELGSISISSLPTKIYLEVGSIGVKHAFTTYFDNFRINAGATNYRSEASMRMVAHGFTNTVLIDSLKVDAILPIGSMLTVKLYGRENFYPNWKLLGEHLFDYDTKKVGIGTPAYVDSVRYGLTGSEGIRFIATNSDSLPILHSITLNTRLEESPPEVTVIQPTPNSAEKWDVYELTLINRDNYSNPFWDVSVSGKFTGPSSQEMTMEGFYYDRNTWKIRFSPIQEGTWDYTVRFMTSRGIFTQSGTFACTPAAPENHGFINVSVVYPHKFVHSDGAPFIPIGITGNDPTQTAVMLGFQPGPNQVVEMWDYISLKNINTMHIAFHHQTQFSAAYPWNPIEGSANPLKESGGLDRYNLTNMKMIDRWFKVALAHGINFYVALFNVFDLVSSIPFDSCY